MHKSWDYVSDYELESACKDMGFRHQVFTAL